MNYKETRWLLVPYPNYDPDEFGTWDYIEVDEDHSSYASAGPFDPKLYCGDISWVNFNNNYNA